MAQWQVQDAKARFSELLNCVKDSGPQVITRHGMGVAAVVPLEMLQQLQGSKDSLVDFFRKAPRVDLVLERDKSPGRKVVF